MGVFFVSGVLECFSDTWFMDVAQIAVELFQAIHAGLSGGASRCCSARFRCGGAIWALEA
jgi:hypothetical protein